MKLLSHRSPGGGRARGPHCSSPASREGGPGSGQQMAGNPHTHTHSLTHARTHARTRAFTHAFPR
eukprot:2111463-Alexandrium_andersonii.AAC.1